jgi:hypothetical protein
MDVAKQMGGPIGDADVGGMDGSTGFCWWWAIGTSDAWALKTTSTNSGRC